jgi:DNA-binding LacI/PurR family transcriptional regulator
MATTKVTATDVAKRAGVSPSAVSRVFTPGASASQDTVARVRKAANDLGYRPSGRSRSRGAGRSGRVGLLVSNVENPFYSHATKLLSVELQERGYSALVLVEMATVGSVERIIAGCLDHQVDGIIVLSVATTSELAHQCDRAGIPSVYFNRSPDDEHSFSVATNNYWGGRRIAEYLIETGHRRISHIAGWELASTQRDREAGFLSVLDANGRSLHSREVANFDHAEARAAALRMFAPGRDLPDAVFVANDHMAFAVLDALRHDLGLKVPQDVSVVGFDDVLPSSWPSYDLTTIRQPVEAMAAEAVSTLLGQVETGHLSPRRVAIDGKLVVRGSTRQR